VRSHSSKGMRFESVIALEIGEVDGIRLRNSFHPSN
jgi:hypothetical protein